MSKALSHSAFHESGHVVAACVLGIAVESVTVIPDRSCERGEVFAAAKTVLCEPLKIDKANVETAAIVLLAGEAAQKKYAARSIIREEDYAADRATLNRLVDASGVPRLVETTEALVTNHWREIEALAGLLLERGRIDFLIWKAGSCRRDPRGRLILATDAATQRSTQIQTSVDALDAQVVAALPCRTDRVSHVS